MAEGSGSTTITGHIRLLRQPLECDYGPADLARALSASAELDTETLICLAGRWVHGGALIAWAPLSAGEQRDPAMLLDQQPTLTGVEPGTIGGGWFGCLGFDASSSWLGFFERVLRRDHAGRWWLESIADDSDAELSTLAATIQRMPRPKPVWPVTVSDLEGIERDTHLAAVEHAISAIRAGELFQVNICTRFSGRLNGEPIALFSTGLEKLHPDYAAYLQTGESTIVSFSPELFLQRDHRQLLSAPIKGTRRRSVPGDRVDDPAAVELTNSAKDRAENVMIVDLMRNDLSRVCAPGTVTTPELLEIRPAPGVWHLVSQVAGTLRPDVGDLDLIRATFPPGSVTGAPKIRALSLIDELEQAPRGLFTGAIGYASPADCAEFNVAIRTFEISGDQFELGVGGGITADSVPMQEWQECLVKAAPLLRIAGTTLAPENSIWPDVVDISAGIFEAILAVDGRLVGLSDHLTRFESSCLEVFQIGLPDDLAKRLVAAVSGLAGRHRVRIVVCPAQPDPQITVAPANRPVAEFALQSMAGRTGCWRHKWNDRTYLASFEAGSTLPLFTKGDLALETSRSNVALISKPGVLATPPLSDDILAGVTRRRFIAAAGDRGWRVEIRPVALDELRNGLLVLSLNASGVVRVGSLDAQRLNLDRSLLGEILGWGC